MDSVNLFIDDNKPWVLAKKIAENPIERESLEYVLAVSLNYFAKLTILIKPILPAVALRVENEVFNIQKPWLWEDIYNLEIKSINPVGHLISRVDQNDLQKINNEV